jgi:gamma-glutamyltranspeptidase
MPNGVALRPGGPVQRTAAARTRLCRGRERVRAGGVAQRLPRRFDHWVALSGTDMAGYRTAAERPLCAEWRVHRASAPPPMGGVGREMLQIASCRDLRMPGITSAPRPS